MEKDCIEQMQEMRKLELLFKTPWVLFEAWTMFGEKMRFNNRLDLTKITESNIMRKLD